MGYTPGTADVALFHGGVFTEDLTGSIDPSAGLVRDFGGTTAGAAAGRTPDWVRLGSIQVDAAAVGEAVFDLASAAQPFLLQPGVSVDWNYVDRSDFEVVNQYDATATASTVVVREPTAVDATGEAVAVPDSAEFVHEWEPYWVEIWLERTDGQTAGLRGGTVDLTYDQQYFTATQVEVGPAFAPDINLRVDDATGRVENVGGISTTIAGDDRPVLLARVRFEPTTENQVPVADGGLTIGPYDLGLSLENVRLIGTQADMAPPPATELWAMVFDIDDDDQIDFEDFTQFVAVFAEVAGSEQAQWADFDGSGLVDFADFALFAPQLMLTKPSTDVLLPPNFPEPWRSGGGGNGQFAVAPTGAGSASPTLDVRLVARPQAGTADVLAELPESIYQVADGQSYVVEVWLRDLDAASLGVAGGSVNLRYGSQATAITLANSSLFGAFARGSLATAGVVAGLGGGTFEKAAGAEESWVRLGYVNFVAAGDEPVLFELEPGSLGFGRYGAGGVDWSEVELGSLAVNTPAGPRVMDVRLSRTGTSGEHSLAGRPSQLAPLGWVGLDRISIQFSEAVVVSAEHLTLHGVNHPQYAFAGFDYDAANFTATWTLAEPLRADKLLVDLSDAITNLEGIPLDGDWIDGSSSFPSGNGATTTDDDFRYRLNVLPGDVDGDATADRGDLASIIAAAGTEPGQSRYRPELDLNADGRIAMADLRAAMTLLGSTLPAAEPGDASLPGAVLTATDAVFARLGNTGSGALAAVVPVRRISATLSTPPATSSEPPVSSSLNITGLARTVRRLRTENELPDIDKI